MDLNHLIVGSGNHERAGIDPDHLDTVLSVKHDRMAAVSPDGVGSGATRLASTHHGHIHVHMPNCKIGLRGAAGR